MIVKSGDGSFMKKLKKEDFERINDPILIQKSEIENKGGIEVYIKVPHAMTYKEYKQEIQRATEPGKVTFFGREFIKNMSLEIYN